MASLNDKITDVRNAARPNSARVTSGRSTGGVTLACDNLSGWPTASKVHFVTYTIDSNSNPVAGTQLDCEGIVSGNNIGSFTVIDGNDTGNSVGDVVEMLPTAAWAQDLADALTSQHSRVGAHVGVTNTGGMTTDTLSVTTDLTVGDDLSVTGDSSFTGPISGSGYSLATMFNPYKFSAYRSTNVETSGSFGAPAKVPLNVELFDTGSNFDIITNFRFTAPINGYYFFSAQAALSVLASIVVQCYIYKNGVSSKQGSFNHNSTGGTNTVFTQVDGLFSLSANDYIELYIAQNAGAPQTINGGQTSLDGFLVSAT